MEKRFVQAGELVIRQAELGEHFYVVDHGQFDVYIQQDGGMGPPQLVHTYVTDGNQTACFGELALLYSKPRAATVVARWGVCVGGHESWRHGGGGQVVCVWGGHESWRHGGGGQVVCVGGGHES